MFITLRRQDIFLTLRCRVCWISSQCDVGEGLCSNAMLRYVNHIATLGYVCHIATSGIVCHIAKLDFVHHIARSIYV